MTPKQIVAKWVEAFNNKDVEALADFYDDNAVNHQVASEPLEGKTAIRQMSADGFALSVMHCMIENFFEDNDWAILEWKDPLGLRGCGFFYIVGSKIKFQRGYWDKLTFLRLHGLAIPSDGKGYLIHTKGTAKSTVSVKNFPYKPLCHYLLFH